MVIVGLLVFAIAYVAFFFRYQPLTATGGTTWADPAYATKVGDFTSPAGEDFTQYNVRYVDGERFSFMFTLTNTGGLPVTVDDVRMYPACADCHYLLQQRSTAMLPHGPNENDPAHARELQPFKLGGGDSRNIVITAKFVDCKAFSEGTIQTYSDVWVQLRSGMIPHDAVLPLGYNLSVTRKGACPS